MLPYAMAKSSAFRSLKPTSLKVLIELRCRFNGSNNGSLFLSYREAAELLGMSKSTVKRAFDELLEKGFLRKRVEGSWYGRKATEYIWTSEPFDGHPATRDWQKWRPDKIRKNQSSVSKRHANGTEVVPSQVSTKPECRVGTRRDEYDEIDGATSVPPLVPSLPNK